MGRISMGISSMSINHSQTYFSFMEMAILDLYRNAKISFAATLVQSV